MRKIIVLNNIFNPSFLTKTLQERVCLFRETYYLSVHFIFSIIDEILENTLNIY